MQGLQDLLFGLGIIYYMPSFAFILQICIKNSIYIYQFLIQGATLLSKSILEICLQKHISQIHNKSKL